ncbi:hypothetical protein MGYG_01319 [Paecilomyces variotii No. 5]|uniref:Uncharacterized protein n=1 Tax=Byssochlamys spectabilis (strain No. 5 / NBRC 109023) TaxID=1356009 RepID=V5G1C8_BYSSN|nr:hypothetical protein MGYG_01319 [Paecilomyces variotii No. 5]
MGKRKKPSQNLLSLVRPINYNFRVTFEVLVSYRLEDYPPRQCEIGKSPRPDETEPTCALVREKVVQVFASSSLLVNKYNDREPNSRRWTIKTNTIATPLPHNRRDEHVNVIGLCPTEISSPVIPMQETQGTSFAEIELMLRILRKNFKVIVNSTCGLRVEIGCFALQHGRCIDREFPLQTLRNFAQLVTLFETELNALHPIHRVLYADYCQLPTQLIKKSQDPVTLLDKCPDPDTLVRTWQEGLNTSDSETPPAYSFSNALEIPEMGDKPCTPGVIEFRQHAGTIDPERVYHWVKLAMHSVRFSHECGMGGLPASLLRSLDEERHCPTGQFDTTSFLRAIGAVEQAEYYRDKLRQYPRPLPRHFEYEEQTHIAARSPDPGHSGQYTEKKVRRKRRELRN